MFLSDILFDVKFLTISLPKNFKFNGIVLFIINEYQ